MDLDTPVNRTSVGQRIASLRKASGFSQAQLASLLNVSRNIVSNIEIGRIQITADILVKLARIFRVSTDSILEVEPPATDPQSISLKLVRRLKKIESLPPIQQRSVLHTLDLALNAMDPSHIDSASSSD